LKDFVSSVIFMLFAAFAFLQAGQFSVEGRNAFNLGFNPAMYPRILTLLMFVLSAILLAQSIRKGALKNIQVNIDRRKLIKSAALFVLVLAYILGMNVFGYIASTLLCVAIFIRLFGGTTKQAVLYSAGITAVLFVIFRIGFNIFLPAGSIFQSGW